MRQFFITMAGTIAGIFGFFILLIFIFHGNCEQDIISLCDPSLDDGHDAVPKLDSELFEEPDPF